MFVFINAGTDLMMLSVSLFYYTSKSSMAGTPETVNLNKTGWAVSFYKHCIAHMKLSPRKRRP